MKQTLLKIVKWTLVTTLLLVFACSKDEINSPLVGTWTGVSFTASEPVDENLDGVAHTDLKEEMDCVSMEAVFTSRGNFSLTSTDATYDVQVIDGKVVLVPTGCSRSTESGNWSLNELETLLTLSFEIAGKDEPTVVEIPIELSASRLVMKELLFSENPLVTFTVEFIRK